MHKALRLPLGLLLLCCLAFAQATFRACQVSPSDLLLLTPKGKFLLHNAGVSWDIANPKDVDAFEQWRLSLKGKPDVSAVVDAVQKGKLGTRVPFAGDVQTTVQGDTVSIAFKGSHVIRLTGGNANSGDVDAVSTALGAKPEALTKALTGGSDWTRFVKAASEREPYYVSLGEKAGVLRVDRAKIVPVAPKPKPLPPPIWTQTWAIVLAVVLGAIVLLALVSWLTPLDILGGLRRLPGFVRGEAEAKRKGSRQRVTPAEEELLAFFREQSGHGEDPSDLLDEVRSRYHKFPTLRKDLEAEVQKTNGLEARVQSLRRYEKFANDADAAFKQYDDLLVKHRSLQEQNAHHEQTRLQLEKNLEGLEAERARLDGQAKAKDRQIAKQKQAIEGLQTKLRDEAEVYRREAEALKRLRAVIDESGTVV